MFAVGLVGGRNLIFTGILWMFPPQMQGLSSALWSPSVFSSSHCTGVLHLSLLLPCSSTLTISVSCHLYLMLFVFFLFFKSSVCISDVFIWVSCIGRTAPSYLHHFIYSSYDFLNSVMIGNTRF